MSSVRNGSTQVVDAATSSQAISTGSAPASNGTNGAARLDTGLANRKFVSIRCSDATNDLKLVAQGATAVTTAYTIPKGTSRDFSATEAIGFYGLSSSSSTAAAYEVLELA